MRKKKIKWKKNVSLIGLVLLIPSLLLNLWQYSNRKQEDTFLVTKILDGDTFVTEDKSVVRLFAISAPEINLCGGREAKEALIKELLDKRVSLDTKVRGSRGRKIAMVYKGKKIVNAELLKTGWYSFEGGKTDDRDLLKSAYDSAREEKKGIYSQQCTQLENLENPECKIKGNISLNDEGKFYHFPGCGRYEDVLVDLYRGDEWFCSEKEAEKAGFVKSKNCYKQKYEK